MVYVERTDEVQAEDFTVLLVQEHIRIRRRLPVDRREISQERDFSRLGDRVRHGWSLRGKKLRLSGSDREWCMHRSKDFISSS